MQESQTKASISSRLRSYIGSVRFFKNLILLAVIIAIAVPSYLAVSRQRLLNDALSETEALKAELSSSTATLTHNTPAVPLSGTVQDTQEPVPEEAPIGEPPAYQSLYPDFYAPQALDATQRTTGVIYLTFDDGPSARTPEILDILEEKEAKATFFVIGETSEQARQWMRDIVAEGHTLGMHSYSHNYDKIYASVEDYLADMYELFCLIKETTGEAPSVFRFPGGSINGHNHAIYQELMAEMLRRGFVPYDWNLSNGDATGERLTVDQAISNVVDSAARMERGFVLMHDSAYKTTTVEALGPMIDQLRELGFTFGRLTPEISPVLYNYD